MLFGIEVIPVEHGKAPSAPSNGEMLSQLKA